MADVTAAVKATADDKNGLTLGDLRKLIEAAENLDDTASVRVKVGWKSQLTEMRIG